MLNNGKTFYVKIVWYCIQGASSRNLGFGCINICFRLKVFYKIFTDLGGASWKHISTYIRCPTFPRNNAFFFVMEHRVYYYYVFVFFGEFQANFVNITRDIVFTTFKFFEKRDVSKHFVWKN